MPLIEDAHGETISLDETHLGKFQVLVRAGTATFISDQAASVGGLGSGPNPYDLLSAAIGSCTLMTVRMYADRNHWPLERVRVRVTHRRESIHDKDNFTKEVELVGALSPTQRKRLLEISRLCPVSTTMANGSQIDTVEITKDPPAIGDIAHSEHVRDMQAVVESKFDSIVNVDAD